MSETDHDTEVEAIWGAMRSYGVLTIRWVKIHPRVRVCFDRDDATLYVDPALDAAGAQAAVLALLGSPAAPDALAC